METVDIISVALSLIFLVSIFLSITLIILSINISRELSKQKLTVDSTYKAVKKCSSDINGLLDIESSNNKCGGGKDES